VRRECQSRASVAGAKGDDAVAADEGEDQTEQAQTARLDVDSPVAEGRVGNAMHDALPDRAANVSALGVETARIIGRSEPIRIGAWRPNRFIVLPEGYHGVLTYVEDAD
jgi:hypothetical protein